jgi:pyruvate,water dikinase
MRGWITEKWIIPIKEIRGNKEKMCGGKASVLGTLRRKGLAVPSGVCVCTAAYNTYLDLTGLRGRVLLELNRKPFEEMRWEELWDLSEKIKHMFSLTPFPQEMEHELEAKISSYFGEKAVAVRSSAPGEDSAKTSFAGVHASYVNLHGVLDILHHIRLVWASLWSDTALLYRKEMGLEIFSSAMAVLIQEIVEGRVSGVAFGRSPDDESESVIEAVYGLNKGLVDGTVEPDRWIVSRQTARIKTHFSVERKKAFFTSEEGTELRILPEYLQKKPPLSSEEVLKVFELARRIEDLFGTPQDIEWTFRGTTLYILQARPITTLPGEGNDEQDEQDEQRRWYLSLRRSFENLKELRKAIEEKYIPEMQSEARELKKEKLKGLTNSTLAEKIEERAEIYQKWHGIYWNYFIPFAHGARLFGKIYNETVNPYDPYEFTALLSGTEMISLERNRKLEKMANKLRKDPSLLKALKALDNESDTILEKEHELERENEAEVEVEFKNMPGNKPVIESGIEFVRENEARLKKELDSFISKYGGSYSESLEARKGLYRLLLKMASSSRPAGKKNSGQIECLKEKFLSRFNEKNKLFAVELLELGRASYRLRDDDNIYLGKIEAELKRAILEGRRRLMERDGEKIRLLEIEAFYTPEYREELVKTLRNPACSPKWKKLSKKPEHFREKVKPRQLLGNPSGKGVSEGYARVIVKEADLFEVKAGEILVCDAVDPNMTFVIPLCLAIIERRGGLLIHGAIIAREYGIPCVTGVPDATHIIKNGDYLSVDGFLGIITVLKRREEMGQE